MDEEIKQLLDEIKEKLILVNNEQTRQANQIELLPIKIKQELHTMLVTEIRNTIHSEIQKLKQQIA